MRNRSLPWNEWKVLVVIKSVDGLISDDGVLKYIQYRLGLRSKETDTVVLSDIKIIRKSLKNKQEVFDEERNEA